jgi:hypothetical protein
MILFELALAEHVWSLGHGKTRSSQVEISTRGVRTAGKREGAADVVGGDGGISLVASRSMKVAGGASEATIML